MTLETPWFPVLGSGRSGETSGWMGSSRVWRVPVTRPSRVQDGLKSTPYHPPKPGEYVGVSKGPQRTGDGSGSVETGVRSPLPSRPRLPVHPTTDDRRPTTRSQSVGLSPASTVGVPVCTRPYTGRCLFTYYGNACTRTRVDTHGKVRVVWEDVPAISTCGSCAHVHVCK